MIPAFRCHHSLVIYLSILIYLFVYLFMYLKYGRKNHRDKTKVEKKFQNR